MTEEQYKFKQKIKCDLNYDVDFNTYHITRGRGWSKADGSCGACIDATFTDSKEVVDKVTLLLCHPLRKYNGKKYKLIEIEDVRTGSIIKIRATKEDREKLLYCCEKTGMTQYEVVMNGLEKVYNEIIGDK